MKKSITIFLFSASILILWGQKKDSLLNERQSQQQSLRLVVDTFKLQNIVEKKQEKEWYKDENMPWIIALVISSVGLILNLYISNRQIKATLGSNNRQEWINQTREVLSELVRQSYLLNIEFQEKNVDLSYQKKLHGEVKYYSSKLSLLLKVEKHKLLLEKTNSLLFTLDEHLLNRNANKQLGANFEFDNSKVINQINDIINEGRTVLYSEWDKIQSVS